MEFRDKFRKVRDSLGNVRIPDIIEYIKDYVKKDPHVTISIGCDSNPKPKNGKQLYVTTVMFYNAHIKNGAHYVYYKKWEPTREDTFNRLYRETEILIELSDFIHGEVSQFYERKDLTDEQIKRYKLHLEQHNGNYTTISGIAEENMLKSIRVTEKDRSIVYKICDVHLDYSVDYGDGQNKSYKAFKATINWFKSKGFRTFCKPYAPSIKFCC